MCNKYISLSFTESWVVFFKYTINIILVVYVQSLKMLLYCLTFKESAEIFCVQLISISYEISLQYCMFIHDLLENVPNAVPGRRHADKFIYHQSISPNIHYVKFWYDCVWFCIKFWWQFNYKEHVWIKQEFSFIYTIWKALKS